MTTVLMINDIPTAEMHDFFTQIYGNNWRWILRQYCDSNKMVVRIEVENPSAKNINMLFRIRFPEAEEWIL